MVARRKSVELASVMSAWIRAARQYPLWIAVFGVGIVVFFGTPGGYANTSYSILHGLCAQTPSHTFQIGGQPLPFDARMTGIYGGVMVALVLIVSRRRLFYYGNLPRMVIAVLGAFVLTMAADGFNSLLTDLRLWHPWETTNLTRLVTGFGTGVALAAALCWLLASSTWNMSVPRPVIGSLRELLPVASGFAIWGLLIAFGPSWLHLPMSIVLVLSAWATVTLLVLVMILLVMRLDATVARLRDLHVPGAMAAILATLAMMALAGLRFWAESHFGISNAML